MYTEDFYLSVKRFADAMNKISNDSDIRFMLAYKLLLSQAQGVVPAYNYPREEIFDENGWDYTEILNGEEAKLETLFKAFSNDVIQTYLEEYAGDKLVAEREAAQDSLCKLFIKILNTKKNELVVDFGAGNLRFIRKAKKVQPLAEYHGIELNHSKFVKASVLAKLIGENVTVEQKNAFEGVEHDKYDKGVANLPFGMRLSGAGDTESYMDKLSYAIGRVRKGTSMDAACIDLLASSIKKTGKAVAVVTAGSLWNKTDEPIREHLLKKGVIEAIIALPNGLFTNTLASVAVVVISHGNSTIKMVDAQECYDLVKDNWSGKMRPVLRVEDILEQLSMAKEVSNEKILNTECMLFPPRWLAKTPNIKKGVRFGDVIKNITRGAPFAAKDKDGLITDEVTKNRYLTISDIQDGMIGEKLKYLKEIEQRFDKYCVKNNDLIISKCGTPFKTAVAQVDGGQKIIASGNLFLVQLDESRIDPYYLNAFFESEVGMRAIEQAAVGTVLPTISLEQMKSIIIPLPAIEEQHIIAKRWKENNERIISIKKELEKAIENRAISAEEFCS